MKTRWMLILGTILMLITVVGNVKATDVTLTWDRNTDSDTAIYYVYQSTTSGQYTLGGVSSLNYKGNTPQMPIGSPVVFTMLDIPDGTYYWIVTALDKAQKRESGKSNEVSATLVTPLVPPKNLRRAP